LCRKILKIHTFRISHWKFDTADQKSTKFASKSPEKFSKSQPKNSASTQNLILAKFNHKIQLQKQSQTQVLESGNNP
jgi:hypothetical protein